MSKKPITPKLKPCPFCGGEHVRYKSGAYASTPGAVVCEICRARGPYRMGHEEASKEAWNTRARMAPK